jgi:hypothetical protein
MTSDALINENIASSSGSPVTSIVRNLGKVKNAGFEALINLQLLDRSDIGMDVTLSGSHNDNKVVTLGVDKEGRPIPTIGTTQRVMAGYPINSFWLVPYTFRDVNNDGLISPSEVSIRVGETTFVGPSFAPNQISLSSGIDLLQRKLRISAQFDHRGGHKLLNNTQGFLCTQTDFCFGKSNPRAELWDQARVVAANYTNPRTNIGYYESGNFIRFRELSATFDAPERFTRRYLRADNLSLSLGVRNLKVWTKYTGEDPEANYNQGDVPLDLLTTAPRRYYTARVNVQF